MSVIFLSDESIALRPISLNDANNDYLSWLNDRSTTEGLVTGTFPVNIESLKHFIAQITNSKDSIMLAICTLPLMTHVGNIKLDKFDWPSGTAELGILIGAAEGRGKGIGYAACGLVIKYAFNDLNLRKISLTVYSANTAAIKLYEKLGFREEGRLKNHVWVSGVFQDKIWMSLFREDYT